MSDRRDYLYAINFFRFVAAFFVVFRHTWDYLPPLPTIFANIIHKEYLGTNFFFILSGFILTHVYSSKFAQGSSKLIYFAKRLIRIYPLYLLTMLVMLPKEWFGVHQSSLDEVSLKLVANVLTLQAWFPLQNGSFNDPAWSVSALFAFFAFLPWIEPHIRSLSTRALLVWSGVFWLLLAVGPLIVAASCSSVSRLATQDNLTGYLRELPLVRLPQFLLGVCAAHLYARGWQGGWFSQRSTKLVTWLLLLLVMATVPVHGTWNVLWQYFAVTPLLLVLVLTLAHDQGRLEHWGRQGWARSAAQASLSVLLIHVPLMTVLFRLYHWFNTGALDGTVSVPSWMILIYWAAVLPFALCVERFFVAPVAHYLEGWFRRWEQGRNRFSSDTTPRSSSERI